MDSYSLAIINTINQLEQSKEKLIDLLFDIAIHGELKPWSDMVIEGEHFYFSREHFESLDYANVTQLIKIIDTLEMKFPQ